MSYPLPLASVLTGATVHQLRSWSRRGLLVPELHRSRPPLYSYRDLVALRSLVRLRAETSLQKIGTAFANLDLVDLTEHPSRYRFATDGRTIVVDPGDGSVIDLVRKPGQSEVLTFEQIMDAFVDFKGREVVDFRRPSRHLEVEYTRLSGWPTVAGTRIPYDLIAKIVDHRTVFERDIPEIYPSVSEAAAADAVAFDEKVRAIAR